MQQYLASYATLKLLSFQKRLRKKRRCKEAHFTCTWTISFFFCHIWYSVRENPAQVKMHFKVIARMKSYYTVIFDQKHLTFSHPNRDHNSNLHVFHWIRSHVKYNYDADYMTACLFYTTRFHYVAHHEHFTRLKWEAITKFSFCQILPWNGIMELYRLVHWNYSCYPMELRSAGVATRPAVDLA